MLFPCTFAVAFIAIPFSLATPPSNDSSAIIQTVGWQSDPNNGRGTFSLVSSCLLTLIICVYSAVHLNVPPPRESTMRYWARTIKWGLWGVFGPELVLFVAWKQYLSAKVVVERTRKPHGTNGSPLRETTNEKLAFTVRMTAKILDVDLMLRWHREQQMSHHPTHMVMVPLGH